MNRKAEHDIRRKLKVFRHAAEPGNVAQTCRYFGISRDTYYRWKKAYKARGELGLVNSKPCPENPKLHIPKDIEQKILYVRREFGLGQLRIKWYLERHYDITVSSNGITKYCAVMVSTGFPRMLRSVLHQRPKDMRKRFQAIMFKSTLNFCSSLITMDDESNAFNIRR